MLSSALAAIRSNEAKALDSTVVFDYTHLAVDKHYQQTAMQHRLISGWWRSVFDGLFDQGQHAKQFVD